MHEEDAGLLWRTEDGAWRKRRHQLEDRWGACRAWQVSRAKDEAGRHGMRAICSKKELGWVKGTRAFRWRNAGGAWGERKRPLGSLTGSCGRTEAPLARDREGGMEGS